MQAATLDAEARRRRFIRTLLDDLKVWGVPERACKGKTVGELIEMHERAKCALMRAPKRAA